MEKTVLKSDLPARKSWEDHAEDLLQRFPGVDRGRLCKRIIAHYFFELQFGNKREERAACEFLNQVQAEAVRLLQQAKAQTAPAGAAAP